MWLFAAELSQKLYGNLVHILPEANLARYSCGCIAYCDIDGEKNIFFCNDARELGIAIVSAKLKFKSLPSKENEDSLLLVIEAYKKHLGN